MKQNIYFDKKYYFYVVLSWMVTTGSRVHYQMHYIGSNKYKDTLMYKAYFTIKYAV